MDTRTVVFANRKGGCGKTTLSSELYYELTRRGFAVNYYNLDNQWSNAIANDTNNNPDYAVVDTPGYLDEAFGETCRNADLIIIPCRASMLDLEPTTTAYHLAKKSGTDAPVLIVINEYDARNSIDQQFFEYIAESDMRLLCTIPRSTRFAQAASIHESVRKFGATTKPAVALAHMADRVEALLKEPTL